MAFNIGKISLGSSAHKRYNHNMSFDNNTTFDFGSVQPLMCQYMMPNSDINVSCKQLVRLAPLVAPSFARVHLQNEVSFVPLADVVPYSDALLAQMPYSVGATTYKPYILPYTTNAMLVYLLLQVSEFTYWERDTTQAFSDFYKYFVPVELKEEDDMRSVSANLFKSVLGVSRTLFPLLPYYNCVYSNDVSKVISFTSADQVVYLPDGSALTFRFSNAARRLRKIFIGLGYSLNITDRTQVAFAPILAFYKAWFDLYAVKRTQNWTNTKCFSVIKFLDDNYYYKFGVEAFNTSAISPVLLSFFYDDLANCWFTYPDDFVSVHRSSVNLQPVAMDFVDGNGASDEIKTFTSTSYGLSAPVKLPNDGNNLFNVALQTLQRLTRFVNKDSVIGQRISDWLRVHYGADVANSVFKQSNHISSSRLDLQINDVFSTSDTASSESGDGEVLGAYAGKGIGFDNNGFHFHTSVTGYVFMLSAIVPESGYYQDNDLSLYGLDRFTLPSADFDALGMELTPKGAIVSDNNIVNYKDSHEDLTDVAFGYIPRFSGYKVKKNIVNGDMSLRSTYDDLSPYYLDRTLTANYVDAETPYISGSSSVANAVLVHDYHASLPVASEMWRYCARYTWLGNYTRIFSNVIPTVPTTAIENLPQKLENKVIVDDNFICQSVFDVRVTNALKPISESYDTFEESTDNSSVDVRPE